MSRLLRTLLLGLLKLVLQLIILAVTGKWVQIGRREPPTKAANKGAGSRRVRPRPATGKQHTTGNRPIFERRLEKVPPPAGDLWGEPETLEEQGALFESELSAYEAPIVEGASSWEQRRQRPPKRRTPKQPPTLPPPKRTSLASALQDPRAIRRAILIGSAVAPRRR